MKRKIINIELDGIDTSDYPDFCDVYVVNAHWLDGQALSDDDLDELNEDRDFVYEELMRQLF